MRLRHAFLTLAHARGRPAGRAAPNPFRLGWGRLLSRDRRLSRNRGAGLPPRYPVSSVEEFGSGSLFTIEPAVAAVRPAQREAEIPDIEAGIKLAHNGWIGRTIQGNDRPEVVPLSIGVSGLWRHFAVAEYRELPRQPKKTTGWGWRSMPSSPSSAARTRTTTRNCLTLTGEFSSGAGIADRYSFLTGGARFNALPNPSGTMIPPIYRPNIDNGLVTFDPDENLTAIKWQAFVVGLQYYLPFVYPRLWVAGLYSRLESSNLADLTPVPESWQHLHAGRVHRWKSLPRCPSGFALRHLTAKDRAEAGQRAKARQCAGAFRHEPFLLEGVA